MSNAEKLDSSEEPPAPLSGIRVLDLSRLVCGNMLTMLLADFGADVIKVEEPIQGDTLRAWKLEGISFFWKVYGRNKRSIALDLRAADARRALLHLVKSTDVLVESFKVGTLEKLGLGPEILLKSNPKLVIVRVSGWGQTGKYKSRPGFGTLVEAVSGFAAKTGYSDRAPLLPAIPLADMVAGIYGAFSTLLALRVATREGVGQVIDLSLLEPMLSILAPDAAIFKTLGRIPERLGSRSANAAPRNAYKTRDGRYVAISASVQAMATRLFRAMDRADLIDDLRFRAGTDRLHNAEEIDAIVADWMKRHTQRQILGIMEKAGVTCAPIYDIGQLLDHEHVNSRRVFIEFPDEDIGSLCMHDVVPRLSVTPGGVRKAAPGIGQDTDAVLMEAGLNAEQIQKLWEHGALGKR